MEEVTGEVFRTATGQWAWRVMVDGVQEAGGVGYPTNWEAETYMGAELAEQRRRREPKGQGAA